MRVKMLLSALALAGAAVFMPTGQVNGGAHYLVFGGETTCRQWTQARREGNAEVDRSWVNGFISGVNWARMVSGKSGGMGSKTDSAGLEHWIDKYCQQHPLEKLELAVQSLAIELSGSQW